MNKIKQLLYHKCTPHPGLLYHTVGHAHLLVVAKHVLLIFKRTVVANFPGITPPKKHNMTLLTLMEIQIVYVPSLFKAHHVELKKNFFDN